MALSTEELNQIRVVIRDELKLAPRSGGFPWLTILILLLLPVLLFFAIILLHVLVIGGFTIYHLLHG